MSEKFTLYLLVFISLTVLNCSFLPDDEMFEQDKFDWLVGNWVQSDRALNSYTIENWRKDNDTLYQGLGATLENNDTVWKEYIQIKKENGNWFFEARGSLDSTYTSFEIIHDTDSSFLSENPYNEFPKKIRYVLKGKQLKAQISGGGPKLDFTFEKAAIEEAKKD